MLALMLMAFLSAGFAACQETSPNEIIATSPVSDSSFHSCVDREVKAAVDRAAKAAVDRAAKTGGELGIYGYHTNIENDIISICNPQLRRETVQDNLISSNSAYSYLNAAVEAQAQAVINEKMRLKIEADRQNAEQDAPRLRAEKEQEDNSITLYYNCLQSHAMTLALNSSEPAEVIAEAAFPSCIKERQAAIDIHRQHNSLFDSDTMEVVDRQFKPAVLLEVIKERAQPVIPPAPTPTKPETPI